MTARWTSLAFAIVSLFAAGRADAFCGGPTATELYNRTTVIADTVIEKLRDGSSPGQVIASMRVVRSLKGAQPGERLEVTSAYSQSETIRFPEPGGAFHLRAVGGPDMYRTDACLYFNLRHSDEIGWCDLPVCQNFRLQK